jgi:TolA-binding protein
MLNGFMAEPSNNIFNDQPVLVEDQSLGRTVRGILIGLLVIVSVVVAVLWYRHQRQHAEETAAAALAKAVGAEQCQQVADQYPATAAGAAALLFTAAGQQEQQDYLAAAELYACYAQQRANSPLAAPAQFARAQCLAAAGRQSEAQAAYLAIVSAKPANPYAGGAAVALARGYLAEHNVSAARQTLTDFLARDLGSSYQAEAGQLLRALSTDSGKK